MKSSIFIKIFDIVNTKKQSLLILLSIVFWIAAVAYSLYLGDNLRYPDEVKYFNLYGQNLATFHIFSLDGIHPTAYNPPLYPLLIGLLISLGSGVVGARLCNFLALFLTMIFIYKLLDHRSFKFSPIISVLLILCYPVLFYTAGTLYPQTIGSLFLVLAAYFYWEPNNSNKNSILTGVFLGLSILTIPTFLFVLPFLLVFAFLSRKKMVTRMILITVFTLLTISPWTIRNYIVFNRFVLFSSNFGSTFLIGNSSATTPNNGPAAEVGIQEYIEEVKSRNLDEFEGNSYYTQVAINLIKKEPIHYGILYFQKVLNYFNFRNELVTKSESSSMKDLVMLITYGFLMLVVLLRFILLRKSRLSQLELFLLLLYLCSAFFSAVVFTRIRYRLPFDYLLILLAALSIERFVLFLNEKTKSHVLLKD